MTNTASITSGSNNIKPLDKSGQSTLIDKSPKSQANIVTDDDIINNNASVPPDSDNTQMPVIKTQKTTLGASTDNKKLDKLVATVTFEDITFELGMQTQELANYMTAMLKHITELINTAKQLISQSKIQAAEEQDARQREKVEDLERAIKKQQRKAATWGVVMALAMVVVAVVLIAVTGGAGAIMAGAMLLDAMSKLVGNLITLIDPEFAAKQPWVKQLAQYGMYAIFGKDAAKAQMIGTAILSVLMLGSSAAMLAMQMAASTVMNTITVLLYAILVVNLLATMYGTGRAIYDQSVNEQSSKLTNAFIGGAFSATLYVVVDESGLDAELRKAAGDDEELYELLKQIMLMIIGLVATIIVGRAAVRMSGIDAQKMVDTQSMAKKVLDIITSILAISRLSSAMASLETNIQNFEKIQVEFQKDTYDILNKKLVSVYEAYRESLDKTNQSTDKQMGDIQEQFNAIITEFKKNMQQYLQILRNSIVNNY